MKKILIAMALMATCTVASAYDEDPYDLKRLDTLKTCQSDAKEESAELALSFAKAIFSWHVGDQVSMLHTEFIAWHSAMTDLLVTFPAFQDKVPFKYGQFTKKTMVETMAFVAYSNNSKDYEIELSRVDCVGNDKVMLVGKFKSMQIQRDQTTGCITHKVPYESPIKLLIELKNEVRLGDDTESRMIYRFDTHIDEKVTVKAREDLAAKVKSEPALAPEPGSCKTRKMIYDEFLAQLPKP